MASEPVKIEATANALKPDETITDDHRKRIIRQLEFYLSDANLPLDRYMFVKTTPHLDPSQGPTLSAEAKAQAIKNGPGCSPIPLQTLCSFQRMRPYSSLYSLTTIANALNSSTREPRLVEATKAADNQWMIRRIQPLTEKARANLADRSVYVKGFLADGAEEPPDMQEILEAWADGWGDVAALRMRRDNPRKKLKGKDALAGNPDNALQETKGPYKWKNSIFIEFHDEAAANKLVEAAKCDEKPTYAGRDLLVMSKTEYVTMKAKELGLPTPDLNKHENATPTSNNDQTDSKSKSFKCASFNAFRELDQIGQGLKTYVGEVVSASAAKKANKEENPLKIEYEGKTVKVNKDGTLPEGTVIEYRDDLVLAFKLLGEAPQDRTAARVNFKDLKETLSFLGPICNFINCPPGQTEGMAGFSEPIIDENVKALNEKRVQGGGRTMEFRRLSKEEQTAYHHDRATFKASQLTSNTGGRGGKAGRGGRGSRGGRGGGRGGGKALPNGGNGSCKSEPTATAVAEASTVQPTAPRKRDAEGNEIGGDKATTLDCPPEISSKKVKVEA